MKEVGKCGHSSPMMLSIGLGSSPKVLKKMILRIAKLMGFWLFEEDVW